MDNKLIYSRKSPLRDVIKSPVGYDIAIKLLGGLGKDISVLKNPLIGGIKLGALPRLTGGAIEPSLVDAIVELLNGVEPMQQLRFDGEYLPRWWKEMVVYQIYPRSFCDSDGDGIGDLAGITSKLDYLAQLGINAIWMSPIYDSPNDDNGYDIRDYRKIMTEFGDMDAFDTLLAEAHSRGIRIIMDMVLNHSSDEHEWFQKALAGEKKYQDYYYFRDGSPDSPPNNWQSFFSGSAWNYYPELKKWALHSFSKKQMDLNWENPELREELYDIMRFWLDKGVDGFRLDVINLISKAHGLPDGSPMLGSMMGFCGIEHYFFGPRLHEFLRELREKSFGRYDSFTVGETPGTGMRMNQMLTADVRAELDTVLCFDHLDNPGKNKYDEYRYDLHWLKRVYSEQQRGYSKNCWNILFTDNHDNPRMISKISSDPEHRDLLAKLIAVLQMTLCGTPFIYQGQEIAMVNTRFAEDELRDVEAVNMIAELKETMTPADALARINTGTRDNARVPMQWTGEVGAGFTTGTPWIKIGELSDKYNAQAQVADPHSVFSAYKQLIALRAGAPALLYGDYIELPRCPDDLYCYYRQASDGTKYYVEINITDTVQKRRQPVGDYTCVFSSYGDCSKQLRPYEANIYLC